ncbi:hypothetical protein SO694_00135063, partial [Aureococcus anophagefferens]
PIVLELKNPNLRKRHWARIAMEVVPGTAAPLVFDPDKTSLGDLFDCGISKHRDIITKVATDATAEAQIELSIHALDAAWEATVLPVLKIDLNEHNSSSSDDASTSSDEPPPAGTNGEPAAPDTIYELGPLDDVANLANDHRAAFRAIAMGEHGMALKPLITVWRQRLDRLTDALRAADDLDRKQRALKPMLAGEREGALAHAWARFNNVHNRWHELLKEIHGDPRPMRLIAPPAEAPEDPKQKEKRRSHKAPKHRARGGRPPELDAHRGSKAGDAPGETPEDARRRRDSAALAGFLNMPEPPSDLKLKQWKLDVEVLDEIKAELKDHLEMKRVAFPRFYYLSDLDLISALGNLRNQGSQTLSHVVLALPALFDAVVTLDRSLEPESDGDANSANSSEKGGRPGSSESSSAPKGAMSMLLGNLKEARPSLSDAEKRRKRSERKASKRRSGRKSATGRRRQKPQKIGALVDAHGERLILPNPVEVYGGVEVWLRELEREMREALRASFAAVVRRQRQEKKRSKRRTSRSPEAVAPCQITLLCERMRWTEDVGDALSTSFRRGSCEPCDECFAKYRDEAERKARAIREGAVRLAPGEEPPEFRDDERARRSGDEALVLLALQHRDVADDVARAAPHMRGLDDYAWQSKLRFYPAGTLEARSRMSKIGGHIGRRTSEMIVPTAASGSATKSGSDLCSDLGVVARQMNAVLPVGVEYVGSAPRTVVTPLGARCVLGLTTAIQALRGVAVVGPHGVGKAEICKDLANTLMSRCVSRAPSDFGTQHENAVKAINHMFAGTAATGAWLVLGLGGLGHKEGGHRYVSRILGAVAAHLQLLMGAVAMRANTVKFAGKDVPLKSFVRSGSEKGETDEDYVSYSGMPLIAVTVSPPRGVSPLNHSIAMILRPVVLAAPDVASVVAGTLVSRGFRMAAAKAYAASLATLLRLAQDTELGERSDGAKGAQLQARWGLRTAMSVVKEADAILRTGDLVSMRRPFQSNQETEAEDERQERAALAMAAKRMLLRSLRNSGDDEATMTELIRTMLPRDDEAIGDGEQIALQDREDAAARAVEDRFHELAGGPPSPPQLAAALAVGDAAAVATGVAVVGPAGCGKSTALRAAALRRDVPTRVLYVAPGALNLEDCFGGSSGSSGCLVSRFSQLADARAAAGGGDAWVVLDGNVERHWTEDLTVQLDRIADRADHGASPRRAACRVLLETDALADSSPSMVSRVGVVHLCGFSLPYEGCDKPCAKRAAAWVARNLRPKLSGTATLVAVADALDDLLEDCPLDDAIGLARRLDERRYFGFEYALEAKFDDDAPELPQHSSARWGAADDDARRLHACLVLVAALLLPSAGSDLEIIGDDAAVAAGAAKIAKCALAWGLAWGVLGTTLALGESEPGLARHLAGDAARWLRKAFGGDALEKDAPLWGACAGRAPRPDLFAFAKWETLAALRMEAFEVASPAAPRSPKDLEALHVPTPRDERVLFVLRSLLRGGVDAEPASWAPDDDDPDGSQRARGVALIEAYERGAGASAVAAAFAARELATAGGAGHVGARVASASHGHAAPQRHWHDSALEEPAVADIESNGLVSPNRRRLHGVLVLAVASQHGHQAVDARGRRHLPPVAVAPPNRAELGAVFCGVVKASLVDRTRRGLDKDLEAAAGQALRVYVRMARFSRDRRAAHPPAPLCVWVRVAKGLRLLPSCHTTLSLRRGIAHELCRELRDGLVAAARPAFDAAVELEGLVPTDDLLVDDADPAVYGAPNAAVKHYSLVERDRKFTRAMREDAGHVSGHGANDRYNDDLDGEADVSDDEEPTLCNRCAFAQRLFDAAADDAGRPPSALAATGHARNVARAARALSAGTVLVQVGERGVGRRSVVDVAAHLCRYEHVFHSPPPPVFSSADAATYQVDGRGCGAVVAASREKNGVRAGRDPDTTWNEVIRRALFAAGGGEPTVVVIADSQWAHSGVTARRLDDLFSAVHTGTVADSRVFRPDDEARVVSDYLDAQIGAQGGNALAAAGARGGAQAGGNHVEVALAEYAARVRTHLRVVVCCCESDLAPIAGDSNCAHPAARRALAAVLPYAAVDRFDDPDEAGCEAAARRWLGVERRKDYDERLKGRTPLVAFVARLSDDDRSGRGAKQANLYERAANAGALIDKALPFAQRRDTARLCVAAYFAAKRAAAACDGPARRLAAPTPVALRTLVVAAVKAAVWRGLALSTASRSVTFGLRKFSEARAATENLATEAEQAKLKANAAFQFTQNSSGLLRSCADVFDEVVARKERARAIKNRTESAYNRLSAVHKQSLGTSVGDYEASTETLTAAAAGGGGIGDLPAAKPVKKILEALSSLLLIQAPSPEEGWELFIRTDFPKLVGEWYGRACKAAARDFEDDNDDTPGDTHAEKRHAWAHGVAQAERALADPSTVASSVRRMGQAGLAVGVPVSVWVRCCCAVWKALCVPQTLAAWASAQDARKADAAASEKHALELDAFEAAQVAEKAAKVAVVDARRFGAETDELAHELGRKHRTALGRFKEIESTLMRWDGRAAALAAQHAALPRRACAPPAAVSFARALPLGGSRRSTLWEPDAAGAVAAATHGPFADVTKVARIQKEASFMAAIAARDDDDGLLAIAEDLDRSRCRRGARRRRRRRPLGRRRRLAPPEAVDEDDDDDYDEGDVYDSRGAPGAGAGASAGGRARARALGRAGPRAGRGRGALPRDLRAPRGARARRRAAAAAPAASDVAAAPPAAAPAVPDVAAAPPADDEALRADDEALEAALPAILRDDGSLEPPDDASLDSQPWMAMMSQISLDVTGESTAALEASLPEELGGLCAAVRDEPAAWRDALEGGQAPQLFFVPSNSGPPEGLDPKFFAKRLLSCHERRVEEGERRKSFLDQMIEQEAEEARLKEERRRYEAGDYDASGDDEDEFGDLKEPSQFAKLLVLRAFRPDLVQKGAELVAASVLAEDGEPARLSAPGAWPPEDPPSLLRAPWVADRQAGTAASAAVALGAACLLAAPLEPVLVTVAADAEDDVFSLFPVVAAAAKTFMAEKNKGAYKASAPPRIAEVGLGSADANDAAATAVSEGRQWGRWVLVRHGELAGGWLPVLLAQLDACDIQRRDREVRKEERVAEQRAAGKGKREAAEAAEAQHEGKKDDSSPAPHDHHRVLIEVVVPPDWSGRGAGGLAPAFPCPRDLARRCGARVAFEPPRGVKARLVAALWDGGGSQSSARLYARLSDEHQRLYYAQVLLHALVRTRRDFGALGVVGRTTPGSAAWCHWATFSVRPQPGASCMAGDGTPEGRAAVDRRLNAMAWSLGVGLRLPQTPQTRARLAEPGFPLYAVKSYDSIAAPELAAELADARTLEVLAKRALLVADRKARKLRKRRGGVGLIEELPDPDLQFGPGEKKSALSDPDVLDEETYDRAAAIKKKKERANPFPQYEPTDSEGDEEDGRTAGTAKASAASHASEWQSDEDDSDCEDVSLPGQDKGDPTSLLTTSPNGLHLAIAGVWGRSPDARTQKGWDGVRDWIHNLPEGEDAELVGVSPHVAASARAAECDALLGRVVRFEAQAAVAAPSATSGALDDALAAVAATLRDVGDHALDCVETNHWFGTSRPNFEIL